METVTVGCRLPNGYVLEVGYSVTAKGADGKRITQLSRRDNYKRFTLRGTHDHTLAMRRQNIQVPSILAPEPWINKNVPKDLWDEWYKQHQRDWVVRSGNIFLIDKGSDPSNVKAAVVDAMAKPAVLAPIDPSKPMTIGKDKVEKADFDESRKAA